MPGTLSATVSIVAGAETGAAFAGSGALSSVNAPKMAAAVALSGAGYLDSAGMFARYAQAAGLAGGGALTAPTPLRIHPMVANLAGAGVLSATAAQAAAHYTDDFNRANASDGGPDWASWTRFDSDKFRVQSNQFVDLGLGGGGASMFVPALATRNYEISFDIPSYLLHDFSIYARLVDDASTEFVRFRFLNDNPGGGSVQTTTIRDSVNASIATTSSVDWRGSRITVGLFNGHAWIKRNGAKYLEGTTTIIGTTPVKNRFGIHSLAGGGSGGGGAGGLFSVTLDNLDAQDISVDDTSAVQIPVNASLTGGGTLSATAVAQIQVAFDTVAGDGVGFSGTTAKTWSHTASGTNRAVVVAFVVNDFAGTVTRTVTYGGTAMTLLGSIGANNDPTLKIHIYGLLNPPATAQTVSLKFNVSGASAMAKSFSYNGVSSFGAVTTTFGISGTAVSQTVSSAVANRVMQSFFVFNNSAITAYNQTSRWAGNSSIPSAGVVVGDAPGAASISFTAAKGSGLGWGGIALNLIHV
jgi:hypothetical protein